MYFFLFCYVIKYTNVPRYIRLSILSTHTNKKEPILKEPILKEPILKENYEDKYLKVFKSFTNDYYFTEEEKELEISKIQ